jgi:hypothetical protein
MEDEGEEQGRSRAQSLQLVRRQIQRGWCQLHSYRRRSGRESYCLVGAINECLETWAERDRVIQTLTTALPEPCTSRWRAVKISALVNFNDAPGRRKGDILALIDRALVEVTK